MTENKTLSPSNLLSFGRHGNAIPVVPENSINVRIGNNETILRYLRYQYIEKIELDDIFQLVANANTERNALFVCTQEDADQLLSEHKMIVPNNLTSASRVTGVSLSPGQSYQSLLNHMTQLHGDAFLLAGGFGAWQSSRLQKQVERHYRTKSGLDEWFYHIPYGVTTLQPMALEARPNRTIYGFDFNTMYASCFSQENYAHPGRFRYRKGGSELKEKCLTGEVSGAFKCELKAPSTWMRQHHLFAKSYGELSVRIELPDQFIAVLHANEIAFWNQHADITIIEGVCSDIVGQHPLKGLADKVYARRMAGDPIAKKLAKQELVLMHSCTARSNKYHVKPDVAINEYGMDEDFAYAHAAEHHGSIHLQKIKYAPNIYSLQRQVLANARVKLLTQIQKIGEQFPEAELCYANVDSLHYSIPTNLTDAFVKSLNIGELMGQLKIEFTGEQGLWLDPGRWWIANDGDLVAHRSGWHQAVPSYKNMSLQHVFQQQELRHWTSAPVNLDDKGRLEAQIDLANLVHQNITHTKRLWQQFTRYLYR
ncbi:hypothetical protein [Methylotenera sp.]|uniref:hypothetical protein n=1 Tax=Methylotenera sp. TaxID=2051956 RepID=UPI0025D8AFA8|nr:hypothetical protein [Methylotenera sp.]